jgi:toxin HigB-1
MDVEFSNTDLDRLETDGQFTANLSQALVKAYRKKMQAIRAASDERDFYKQRSFNYEELQGKRKGQFSIRLNDQFRLIFSYNPGNPDTKKKTVNIIDIEDYH